MSTERSYVGGGTNANIPPSEAQNEAQTPSPRDKRRKKVRVIQPPENPPLWYTYQEQYSQLEQTADKLARSHRLSLNQEAVYNIMNSLTPYRGNTRDLPDEVVKARIVALRLTNYFLDQLIIANPLLLPMGYEISNQDNYLDLIQSPFGGVFSLRTDSMAPLLPKDTAVAFWQLQPNEWKETKRIVSIYRYSDYDNETIGIITNVTDDAFTLKSRNPDWPDVVIPWSDVVRILGLGFLVGAKIEADYE